MSQKEELKDSRPLPQSQIWLIHHTPHSAYRVWQRLFNKDFEKLAPGLRAQQGGTILITIMLIIGGIFTFGFASLLALHYIHPPLQLAGVCNPPARIEYDGQHNAVNCVTFHIETININGQNTIKNVSQPAGQLYYLNGSRLP